MNIRGKATFGLLSIAIGFTIGYGYNSWQSSNSNKNLLNNKVSTQNIPNSTAVDEPEDSFISATNSSQRSSISSNPSVSNSTSEQQSTRSSTSPIQALAPKETPSNELTIKCTGSLAQEFLCLLNNYRTEKGLNKLSYSNTLSEVALTHSLWMNETGNFSHTGNNNSDFSVRCANANTVCRAENLAHNITNAEKLLDSWKANPRHHQNLLGNFTTMGFGLSGTYVTLLLN